MFQTTSQTQYVGCLSEKAWTCPTTFKNMKSWPGAANSQTHPQRKKVPKLADTTWWQYPRAHVLVASYPKRVIGCCWKQLDMSGLEVGCIFWSLAMIWGSHMAAAWLSWNLLHKAGPNVLCPWLPRNVPKPRLKLRPSILAVKEVDLLAIIMWIPWQGPALLNCCIRFNLSGQKGNTSDLPSAQQRATCSQHPILNYNTSPAWNQVTVSCCSCWITSSAALSFNWS